MSCVVDFQEYIHGTMVSDPFRVLEDRHSSETSEWIRRQHAVAGEYFGNCKDLDILRSHVRRYLSVETVDQPHRVGNSYFFRKRMAEEEQSGIWSRDITSGAERLLVGKDCEPNDHVSLGIECVSPDGRFLAYGRRLGGSDRRTIHVLKPETGGQEQVADLPLGRSRGIVFTDNGFFYCHETEDTSEHKVFRHIFGGKGPDRIVCQMPRINGSRLILKGNTHHLGLMYIRPRGSDFTGDFILADVNDVDWRFIFRDRVLPCSPILYEGRLFIVDSSPIRGSGVIELSLDGGDSRTIIPREQRVIHQLALAGDRLYVNRAEGGKFTVEEWSLSGRCNGTIDLPSDGTIRFQSAGCHRQHSFFYRFESAAHAPTIYEYLADSGRSEPLHRSELVGGFAPKVERTAVHTKDGTTIPITITTKNEAELPRRGPAILTSYGGFGAPASPQFSVFTTILFNLGVTLVVPQIRGCGGFNSEWHRAGRARNRPRSINDFVEVAEWMSQEKITTPERLAIFGGSNSGLLVAAAMTQRPELFAAVLCIAPLLDMVRYEVLDDATRWRWEYGTVEDLDDFRALYSYSPYHHVEDRVNYPSVLFVTGDRDERCNPSHVRKMAARLQSREIQNRPVIVDYSELRGHMSVLPLSVRVEALTRRLAFICREIGVDVRSGEFL